MKAIICDICKSNKATTRYKVKETTYNWYYEIWNSYKRLDVCDTCASKLFEHSNNAKHLLYKGEKE